MNRKIT